MEEKKQGFFKWIFTRWYLYVLAILFYVILDMGQGFSTAEKIGRFIGDFIISVAFISFIVGVRGIWRKINNKEQPQF